MEIGVEYFGLINEHRRHGRCMTCGIVRRNETKLMHKGAVPHRSNLKRHFTAAKMLAAVLVASGSSFADAAGDSRPVRPRPAQDIGSGTMEAADKQRITIQGVRLTMGDGVDCAKVRADDGTVTGVSYLAPSIEIGQRVEVTGFMAIMTTCRGKVLYAEEVRALGN
jgi:hypothetical protein